MLKLLASSRGGEDDWCAGIMAMWSGIFEVWWILAQWCIVFGVVVFVTSRRGNRGVFGRMVICGSPPSDVCVSPPPPPSVVGSRCGLRAMRGGGAC